MGRIVMCGFENNDSATSNNSEFSNIRGAPTIVNTNVRTGTYAGRVTGMTSGTQMGFQFGFLSGFRAWYARGYFRFDTLPSAANAFLSLAFDVSTECAWITIDNTGALQLNDEDGAIGSASDALATGVYHRVELLLDIRTAAGSHIVAARVNGVEFARATNRSVNNGPGFLQVGANLRREAQTQGDWRIDDVAVNDDQGSFQNEWPGDGGILYIRPNAAGEFAQGTRGGADSGSDWGQLDEVTPNGATDYYDLDANNEIIDVNCQSCSDVGIPLNSTISVVNVCSQIRAETAANMTCHNRLKTQNGGTLANGGNITRGNTQFVSTTVASFSADIYSYTDPQSGERWTPTLVDAIQVGVQVTDATPDCHISAIWAKIEFKNAGIPVERLRAPHRALLVR